MLPMRMGASTKCARAETLVLTVVERECCLVGECLNRCRKWSVCKSDRSTKGLARWL